MEAKDTIWLPFYFLSITVSRVLFNFSIQTNGAQGYWPKQKVALIAPALQRGDPLKCLVKPHQIKPTLAFKRQLQHPFLKNCFIVGLLA